MSLNLETVKEKGLTKRWSEPPPRRVFILQMIKTDSLEATLALGGGRSACSR